MLRMKKNDMKIILYDNTLLNPEQIDIYNGLKSIGNEIASFYLDGVKIYKNGELKTKSYLLSHIAREMESGIRDILSEKERDVKKCEMCGQLIVEQKSHIESICEALGVDKEDYFAREWFKVSKKFHKYAHRQGAWEEPREEYIGEEIWKDFEKILLVLVGNFYNLLNRVDRIIKYEKPSERMIQVLPNLLKLKAREYYFFKNLKSKYWLKALKEKGYFNPENNPTSYNDSQKDYHVTPYWHILNYLRKVTDDNLRNFDQKITDILVEIVNSIINYKDESGRRIDNHKTDFIMVRIIRTFPKEKIEKQHIDFIKVALQTKWGSSLLQSEIVDYFIPKLIKDKNKECLLYLLEIILSFQEKENKYTPLMEEYHLKELIKKNTSGIAELCGLEAVEVAINKIKYLIKHDYSDFNNKFSIYTIEDNDQSSTKENYECQLVHFIRDVLCLLDVNQIKGKVEQLFTEKQPIFNRIAIYIIAKNYKKLNDIFWGFNRNFINKEELKHELYELVKNNCRFFNDKQLEKVINWIEKASYISSVVKHEYFKDNQENIKKYVALKKKEWLTALLETKNEKVLEKYNKYDDINPKEITHPGYDYWFEDWQGDKSPITKEELLEKTNKEIADYFINYKEEGEWGMFSISGLSYMFRESVFEQPERFVDDLNPFLEIPRIYQSDILSGITRGCRENKIFDWKRVFVFIDQIISVDYFWKEKYQKRQHNYREWVISEILELIKESIKDDKSVNNLKFLPKIEKILLKLASKIEPKKYSVENIVNKAINSNLGKLLSAMVFYSFRYAKKNKSISTEKWPKKIKIYFNKILNRKDNPPIELGAVVGKYLPNIYYLDKEWITINFNNIFNKEIQRLWEVAFSSYLFYSATIYKEFYILFKQDNHLLKGIVTNFEEEFSEKHFVQHICLAYLEGWEKLEDSNSTICKLIENKKIEHLEEVISFMGSKKNRLSIEKIKPLWRKMNSVLKNEINDSKYQKVIVRLINWLDQLEELDDDVFNWIILSVKYIYLQPNIYSFLKSLLVHVEKSPQKIGIILIEMADKVELYSTDEEDIKKIVQKLYERDQKDIADKIAITYGENSYYFLQDLYNFYNKIEPRGSIIEK
jgi:hypothetical protein